MRIILYGASALSYWLTAPCRPSQRLGADCGILDGCAPTKRSLAYLRERLPQIPMPYHVQVRVCDRPQQSGCRVHGSRFPYGAGAFLRVDHGIYVASPELCFLQLAECLPTPQLAMAGNALAGTFRVDPLSPTGLSTRRPLSSGERLANFAAACEGHKGSPLARRAAALVCDKTASPPEAFLALALTAPTRLGGFGLSGSAANVRLTPTKRARAYASRTTLVPDLLFEDGKIVVEYDSDEIHLLSDQASRDSMKRLALEADGYTVITVNNRTLRRADALRHIACEIARTRGRRLRIRGQGFSAQQAALFESRLSLGNYVSDPWYHAQRAKFGHESAGV